jgi:hypothetical protein
MHPELTHLLANQYQSERTGRGRTGHHAGLVADPTHRSLFTRAHGAAVRLAGAAGAEADRLRTALTWRHSYLAGTSDRRSR